MIVRSFAPIAAPDAHTLILGSMPGIASLEAGQYYAHPRNAFWPIMGALYGAWPGLPYAERVEQLKVSGVAVWDVLQSCVREGSLDADIREEVPNDFTEFFARHQNIRRIGLNGGKAAASFRKHAARGLEEKCALWRVSLLL